MKDLVGLVMVPCLVSFYITKKKYFMRFYSLHHLNPSSPNHQNSRYWRSWALQSNTKDHKIRSKIQQILILLMFSCAELLQPIVMLEKQSKNHSILEKPKYNNSAKTSSSVWNSLFVCVWERERVPLFRWILERLIRNQ